MATKTAAKKPASKKAEGKKPRSVKRKPTTAERIEKNRAAIKAAAARKVNPGTEKKAGRPSLYLPEYDDQARRLCLLGATDEELADFFGVVVATIDSWKHDHSTFLGALKSGKLDADSRVSQSLFNRAIGYTGKKTVTANIGGAITDVKEVDEYVGPDTTACIFWLKNRQRDKWCDKVDHELTGKDGGPIATQAIPTDPAEAARVYKKMMG